MIRAVALGDDHTFTIQCDFIAGSNAQGCVVVLVGEFDNATGNLTRDSTLSATGAISVLNPTSYYFKVFAFDIESDGSVDTLAVPGELRNISSKVPICMTGYQLI